MGGAEDNDGRIFELVIYDPIANAFGWIRPVHTAPIHAEHHFAGVQQGVTAILGDREEKRAGSFTIHYFTLRSKYHTGMFLVFHQGRLSSG